MSRVYGRIKTAAVRQKIPGAVSMLQPYWKQAVFGVELLLVVVMLLARSFRQMTPPARCNVTSFDHSEGLQRTNISRSAYITGLVKIPPVPDNRLSQSSGEPGHSNKGEAAVTTDDSTDTNLAV